MFSAVVTQMVFNLPVPDPTKLPTLPDSVSGSLTPPPHPTSLHLLIPPHFNLSPHLTPPPHPTSLHPLTPPHSTLSPHLTPPPHPTSLHPLTPPHFNLSPPHPTLSPHLTPTFHSTASHLTPLALTPPSQHNLNTLYNNLSHQVLLATFGRYPSCTTTCSRP